MKFTKILISIISVLSCFILISCSNNIDSNNESNEIELEEIKPIGNISDSKDYYDEVNSIEYYEDLFNINNKIEVYLDVDPSELQLIENDVESDTYYKANSITIKITKTDKTTIEKTINEIGIKMKGNTSRGSFFKDGSMTTIRHWKLSFNETFDGDEYENSYKKIWSSKDERKLRKNRTFFGLNALELKSNHEMDTTYTKEIYASKVYRKLGIYAQNINLGVLSFKIGNNSGSLGVYKIYEPIDRIFLKRYFNVNDSKGDLYKATWGKNVGMPNLNNSNTKGYGVDESLRKSDKLVTYALKTNKDDSDQEDLSRFINWVSSSKSDISPEIETYMNYDYYIMFMAIQYLTGDWDNFLYDTNNYYLYFLNGKAFFIPYDMDRPFGIQ